MSIDISMESTLVGINCGFNGRVHINAPYDCIPSINDYNPKEPLTLVLDPSSRQTGIVLGDDRDNLKFFADFINKTCTVRDYSCYLNQYIAMIAKKYTINQFVYEIPFSAGDDIAYSVLHSLEQTFDRFYRLIPTLTKDNMFPILPAVWRKTFFKDKCYNGRKKERALLKEAAREESSKRHPEYAEYFHRTKYVPDSTDAIGIYHGFLEEYWYDRESNIRRVSKVNSKYSRNTSYEYDIICDSPINLVKQAKAYAPLREVDLFAYNKDFKTAESCEIVMAQSHNVCLIIAFDKISTEFLQWESGIKPAEGELLAVRAMRRN